MYRVNTVGCQCQNERVSDREHCLHTCEAHVRAHGKEKVCAPAATYGKKWKISTLRVLERSSFPPPRLDRVYEKARKRSKRTGNMLLAPACPRGNLELLQLDSDSHSLTTLLGSSSVAVLAVRGDFQLILRLEGIRAQPSALLETHPLWGEHAVDRRVQC